MTDAIERMSAKARSWLERLTSPWRIARAQSTFGSRPPLRSRRHAQLRPGSLAPGKSPPRARRNGSDVSRLAADDSMKALTGALAHADPSVRARALEVVCEFADERAVQLVLDMLNDPTPSVRCSAASVAAGVHTSRVVAPLIVALDDPEGEVRRAAGRAIEQLTGIEVHFEEPNGHVPRAEVDELKRLWKEQRLKELISSVDGAA